MTEPRPAFLTVPPPDYDTAEARTVAITQLLGAAETTTEYNALSRIARRAGFLWRCPSCRADQYPDRKVCPCGAHRPAGATP
ncbi:hypothetical protein [Streptomyces erythrochromogenes]|uniref:hypothetical protein n=1 Tax=Streptomyces erythrochromogenes TaxID=285574 RepID=UPI0022594DBE|nr:hypothetical protein [Streptomyces erythrochromogenes]MCX5587589.1 hypothetical protein [Streptomyces erythrochromogenes]